MKLVFFPRGVIGCEEQRQWNLFKEVRDAVLVQLSMPLSLSDITRHRDVLRRGLRESRSNRPRQLKRLRLVENI